MNLGNLEHGLVSFSVSCHHYHLHCLYSQSLVFPVFPVIIFSQPITVVLLDAWHSVGHICSNLCLPLGCLLCVRAHIFATMFQELRVLPSKLSDRQVSVKGKQQ